MHRDADRVAVIRHGARHGLTHPPGCVRGELIAAAVFELIHGLHKPEVTFLNEVGHRKAAVDVALRNRNHEAKVRFDHLCLGVCEIRLRELNLTREITLILKRQKRGLLGLAELFLQMKDQLPVQTDLHAVGLAGSGKFINPLLIHAAIVHVSEELLHGHAAAVNHRVSQAVQAVVDLIHVRADDVREMHHGLNGKAHRSELFGNLGTGLVVLGFLARNTETGADLFDFLGAASKEL